MAIQDRMQYAEWALREKNDPKPLLKLREQLEATRIGQQLRRAEELLSEHAQGS